MLQYRRVKGQRSQGLSVEEDVTTHQFVLVITNHDVFVSSIFYEQLVEIISAELFIYILISFCYQER